MASKKYDVIKNQLMTSHPTASGNEKGRVRMHNILLVGVHVEVIEEVDASESFDTLDSEVTDREDEGEDFKFAVKYSPTT